MTRSDEPRSSLAIGFGWVSRISSVGLMFVVPSLLGVFLDRWWGTNPIALLIGTVLGFTLGMMEILRIAREGAAADSKRRQQPPE